MGVRAFVLACLASSIVGQQLSQYTLGLVQNRMDVSAQLSWELGTRAQTLLELYAPEYSVVSINASSLPPPASIPSDRTDAMNTILGIAKTVVARRNVSNGFITGPQPFMMDDAAGDPASIGVAVLLANWTGRGAIDNLDYAGAAKDQLDFLLYKVPRTSDGAISHRVANVQLWSDNVYMVPPFLAFYGVTTSNATLLQMAYDQISLYRGYMRDTSANNQWKHVLFGGDNGSDPDPQHWSTGNGWAAAGMLRVLATMKASQFSSQFGQQMKDLAGWVLEIHQGMYGSIDTNTNIFQNWNDLQASYNFPDAASTAIMAATVYRLSTIWGTHTYLPHAEACRAVLYGQSSQFATEYTSPTSSTTLPPSTSSSSSIPVTSNATSTGSFSSLPPTNSSSSSSSSFSSASSTSSTLPFCPTTSPVSNSSSVAPSTTGSASSVSGNFSSTASATSVSGNLNATSTSASSQSAPPSCIPVPTTSAIVPGPTSTDTPLKFFTNQGWLSPVVNPHNYGTQGAESPESEAFVLQMNMAWQEWVKTGAQGANAASHLSTPMSMLFALVLVAISMIIFA